MQFATGPDPTDLLTLPWSTALERWPNEKLVSLPRGISRHVVRFVRIGGIVYAIKEISKGLAEHEYELLRALAKRELPAVQALLAATPGLIRGAIHGPRCSASEPRARHGTTPVSASASPAPA